MLILHPRDRRAHIPAGSYADARARLRHSHWVLTDCIIPLLAAPVALTRQGDGQTPEFESLLTGSGPPPL